MSWEEMSKHTYNCPCRKGNYTVVSEMDDWNRTSEKVSMDCIDCKENYVQKYFTKPDGDQYWKWVLKE